MKRINLIAVIALALTAAIAIAVPIKPCELMEMMMNRQKSVQEQGIAGFVKMGDNAAVPLLCYMGGTAPGAPKPTELGKVNAEIALVKLGGGAITAILERLGTQNIEYRVRLVRILGKINDPRREQALLQLWDTENNDRVRAVLTTAVGRMSKHSAVLPLRERIPLAGMLELRALMVQLALYGNTSDLQTILTRVPSTQKKAFISQVVKELKLLGTSAGKVAAQRISVLK